MNRIFVVLLAIGVASCGGLLARAPLPERVSYMLELSADDYIGETEKRCKVLRLGTLSAATGQLGTAMHYKEQAQRLQSFAYSSWIDAPVDMIEPQLRRALNESGLFEAVVSAESPVRSDLSLTISQLSLLLELDRSPSAFVLEADLELADPIAFELIASGRLSIAEETAANPQDGAGAANRAVARFTRELITFLRDATEAGDGCE